MLLKVGNYATSVDALNQDKWTAYGYNKKLYIEHGIGADVMIYNLQGIVVYSAPISSTTTIVPLPAGLYMVVIDGDLRKVLID